MKKDIINRGDIIQLIDAFYMKAKKDAVIGHFFTEVIPIDWDHHMPVIYDFWESVLLDNPVYKGNPMDKHLALDEKSRLENEHFDRWINLFNETVDEHFTGEKAELAKNRASQIRTLMAYKVEQNRVK